jgi:hypothetical protein
MEIKKEIKEEWGNHSNFPKYKISNLGNIKRISAKNLMKLGDTKTYIEVGLVDKNKSKCVKVHRLVAEVFIPNPENKPTVNHKDANKYNNKVSNLEWATCKEQAIHSVENKLKDYSISSTSRPVQIYKYDKDENFIEILDKKEYKIYESVKNAFTELKIGEKKFREMLKKGIEFKNYSAIYTGICKGSKKQVKVYQHIKNDKNLQWINKRKYKSFSTIKDSRKELNISKFIITNMLRNENIYNGYSVIYLDLCINLENEIWNPIKINCDEKTYEGYYISNFGRIKYDDILKNPTISNKYEKISILGKQLLVHRLVAEAFISNPENKPQVDHIDTNVLNNNLTNLRWVTPSENVNNELTKKHISDAVSKPVEQYDSVGNLINIFKSMTEASKEMKVNMSSISRAVTLNRMCADFYWKLISDDNTLKKRIDNRSKSVSQYNNEGELIKTFSSMTEASKEMKVDISSISKAVRDKNRCQDFYWEYTYKKDDFTRNKIIGQYDVDGNLIKKFDSVTEASKELDTDIANISKAIHNNGRSKEFYWKIEQTL